ncbi:MAG TPA: hypothetical protein VLS49_15895 [Usitatibacter sp.]|nr:hypothetical protein [Usitatibacter sp.]
MFYRFLSVALTACAILTCRAESGSAKGGGSASASLDITVRIARVVRLRALDLPASIDITKADIERGEIVVRGRLDLLVNDPRGFILEARLLDRSFSGFRIDGLPRTMEGNEDPVSVELPANGRREPAPTPVEYRFRIAPDALPGPHRWPLMLTLGSS